jgi:membrane protein DedA with SNARE-associated domain
MMYFSLNTIFGWVVMYRYVILLPIAIVEGPIISVIAGFLVSLGQMNFLLAYVILVLGDVMGDLLLYALGRWGRGTPLQKYGKYFGVTAERIAKLEKFFEHHAKKTLLFGKWGHALGFPILLSAGAVKEPIGEFVTVSILGTLPKTLILMLVGFYFGQSYDLINKYITYAALGMIGLAVLVGVGYWFSIQLTKKYFENI